MYFQSIEGGELFPFHGEPSPREIHTLYEFGQRVAGESYPDELADIYRANGREQVPILRRVGSCAMEFISRHEALKLRGVVAGPTLNDGILDREFMSLWVPRAIKV